MNVFELAAVLSLNTSEYEQGLATAASDGNKASSSITSKFVGAGWLAVLKSFMVPLE